MTLSKLRNVLRQRAKQALRRRGEQKLIARAKSDGRADAYTRAADLLDEWLEQHSASDAAREVAGK